LNPKPILLDATPLALICHPDHRITNVREINNWLEAQLVNGVEVWIPEIADYEVRRELLRAGKLRSIRKLDSLASVLPYLPINTAVVRRAAELWAKARRSGHVTAPPEALDGDVILAAQAEQVEAIIATENPSHLSWFVSAKSWRDLPPGE
jgi:predicted nucleic acid-binding protein